MGVWLDRAIISTIVVIGLFIMYRALKEPLDLLFGLIARGFSSIKEKMSGTNVAGGYETITYG